jgi:ADP-ribose pyrophosphatase
MKHTIAKEQTVYDGFLKVVKAQVEFESFNDQGTISASRECLERGDSVAILLHDTDVDCFVFTRQYRYPSARRDQPWMLELVAGSIDDDESPQECARRETLEESGYRITDLQKITTYFPSPGGCSEQIHLFYAPVTSDQKSQPGGGNPQEKEDIQIVNIQVDDARQKLKEGYFNNSISIICLQWYFLNLV